MQQGPARGLSSKGAERHPSGKSTRTFDLIFALNLQYSDYWIPLFYSDKPKTGNAQ